MTKNAKDNKPGIQCVVADLAMAIAESVTPDEDINDVRKAVEAMTKPPTRDDLGMTPCGASLPERALLLALAGFILDPTVDRDDIKHALEYVLREQ
jgi:hypothetical protein